MKKMSWLYFPKKLGRESGVVLAIGLNRCEEYICTLREGENAYIIWAFFNDGKEQKFYIENDDEQLMEYVEKNEKKFEKGEISPQEFDMKLLRKLCKMAQKEISNR